MNKAFDKILERLEQRIAENTNDNMTYKIPYFGLFIAKKIVQEVAEEYTSTDTSTNGWIPCSERLPDDLIDVLVWFEYYRFGNYNGLYQTIGISYTNNGEWSRLVNGTSGWKELRIIAWQPLPQPYKESE